MQTNWVKNSATVKTKTKARLKVDNYETLVAVFGNVHDAIYVDAFTTTPSILLSKCWDIVAEYNYYSNIYTIRCKDSISGLMLRAKYKRDESLLRWDIYYACNVRHKPVKVYEEEETISVKVEKVPYTKEDIGFLLSEVSRLTARPKSKEVLPNDDEVVIFLDQFKQTHPELVIKQEVASGRH